MLTLRAVNHTFRSTHFSFRLNFGCNFRRICSAGHLSKAPGEKAWKKEMNLHCFRFSLVNSRLLLLFDQLNVAIGNEVQWKIVKFTAKVVTSKSNSKWSRNSKHKVFNYDLRRKKLKKISSAMCKFFVMILILLTILCNYLMINLYKCLWVFCGVSFYLRSIWFIF